VSREGSNSWSIHESLEIEDTRKILCSASLAEHRRSQAHFSIDTAPFHAGCGSFFCMDGLFGTDNQRPPPRMIESLTVRTGSDFPRCRSRRVHASRDGFNRRAWSGRPTPEQQVQEAGGGLFTAPLGALVSHLLAQALPLPRRSLPCLVPAIIADGIAHHQHGVNVVGFEIACRPL
jgi:hypothetical protein